jgi:hypothetical protein
LTASDAVDDAVFGGEVRCSADGSTVVIAAGQAAGGGTQRGAVYVYSGANWGTETILTASDGTNGDYLGRVMVISSDASVIVASTTDWDNGGGPFSNYGKVYVWSGANWGTETGLTASDPAATQQSLGFPLTCSDDGSVVIAGATRWSATQGKVYVWSGANWGTETGLTASDSAANDRFAWSTIACSADASVIAVGAPWEDGAGTDRGKIYVYSGANWGTETGLTASDAANGDELGNLSLVPIANEYTPQYGVMCSADGTLVAAASKLHNSLQGKVYVWSGANWGTETGLTASDAANGDQFGTSMTRSDDIQTIFVGSPLQDTGGSNAGKAYVYSSAFVPQIYRRL